MCPLWLFQEAKHLEFLNVTSYNCFHIGYFCLFLNSLLFKPNTSMVRSSLHPSTCKFCNRETKYSVRRWLTARRSEVSELRWSINVLNTLLSEQEVKRKHLKSTNEIMWKWFEVVVSGKRHRAGAGECCVITSFMFFGSER